METKTGSPEHYADELYWEVMQYDNLETDEVRDLCKKVLNRLYIAVDEPMKTYYKECIHYINRNGGK